MRVLLDTHAVVWWAGDPGRLSPKAHSVIADAKTEVFVSVASAWEIQINASLGKLTLNRTADELYRQLIVEHSFRLLGMELADFDRLSKLPAVHRDPFDRVLVAQSLERDLTLVTKDKVLDAYGGDTLW